MQKNGVTWSPGDPARTLVYQGNGFKLLSTGKAHLRLHIHDSNFVEPLLRFLLSECELEKQQVTRFFELLLPAVKEQTCARVEIPTNFSVKMVRKSEIQINAKSEWRGESFSTSINLSQNEVGLESTGHLRILVNTLTDLFRNQHWRLVDFVSNKKTEAQIEEALRKLKAEQSRFNRLNPEYVSFLRLRGAAFAGE